MGTRVMVSVLAGTSVGFVVKYLLDKPWIIFFKVCGGRAIELREGLAYGMFSAGTTLLFCGIELTAWQLWQTTAAEYVGAVVGLSLGNRIKCLRDNHYVFGKTA